MRFLFSLFLITVCLIGCDSKRTFEQYHDFENKAWLVNDTPLFEFEIKDTAVAYNLSLNIRNSVAYPFSRIFINYYLEDSTGLPIQKKLAQTFLFDQKTGKPQGSSGLGDIYDQRLPLINNYQFTRSGKYKMKLEQFMRTDTLQGVLAVGLRVEKAIKD